MIENKQSTHQQPTKKTATIKEPEPAEEPVPIIEYNNKTEESYKSKFLPVPDRLDYQVKQFLSEFDPAKGDLEKKVNTIVRIMAIDYSDKQKKQKEFMYWYENWYGKNWQGQTIPPVTDHIEGIYQEQDVEPIIERNRKIGDQRVGQHDVYYIPFSKEKVDELIASSIGSEKETINYVVKTPTIRSSYSYDQFVNSSFAEAVQMMHKQGGPQLVEMQAAVKAQVQTEKQQDEKSNLKAPASSSPPNSPKT